MERYFFKANNYDKLNHIFGYNYKRIEYSLYARDFMYLFSHNPLAAEVCSKVISALEEFFEIDESDRARKATEEEKLAPYIFLSTILPLSEAIFFSGVVKSPAVELALSIAHGWEIDFNAPRFDVVSPNECALIEKIVGFVKSSAAYNSEYVDNEVARLPVAV